MNGNSLVIFRAAEIVEVGAGDEGLHVADAAEKHAAAGDVEAGRSA